jgi:hypothetical protein
MDQKSNVAIIGKKVFFLYPTTIVQHDVVEELIQQEYEVYIIQDHKKLQKIVAKYPAAVILVNIGDQLSANEWEQWIRRMKEDPVTAKVDIGILSPSSDEKLRHRFDVLKINCGFTLVKSDTAILIKQVLEAIKPAEAKGRRKYIRTTLNSEDMAAINMPINGQYVKGVIKDISSIGLSCVFEDALDLGKNAICKNIQIKLHSILLKAEGILIGSRMDENLEIHVIVFTQRTDPAVRTKIRKYIQSAMQTKIDAEFK